MRIDNIMGIVLTEKEKEKQASYISLTSDLINGLLGEEKISLQDFAVTHMRLKYFDSEQTKKIGENLSENEKNKFPSMGLFKNNQNEYIRTFDVDDIRMKVVELAKEEIERIGKNLINGNKKVSQSENAIDSLTIHFKWSECMGKENLFFDGKEGVEFISNLIETDNIYNKERITNNDKDADGNYMGYHKTKLGLQYSGLYYELERIDIGDGEWKNLKQFVEEREEKFIEISKEIEKLNSFIPQKIIDEFKENYKKLFQEMKEYTPEIQNFKTSEQGFDKMKIVLEEKYEEQKKIDLEKNNKKKENENPWKKDINDEKEQER